jgi:hypothetical protein
MMKDAGRPGLDYPCPTCQLIGLASPLCHESREQTSKRNLNNPDELTPLAALRRLDRHLGDKREPKIEEALTRLWAYLIEGK